MFVLHIVYCTIYSSFDFVFPVYVSTCPGDVRSILGSKPFNFGGACPLPSLFHFCCLVCVGHSYSLSKPHIPISFTPLTFCPPHRAGRLLASHKQLMDDNLAWCPVCDRQILPRFVPVNPLQPTAPVAKPETPPLEAGATIVLPPPVKAARPGLRKAKTALGRVKRVSPPKTNDQLRRISTQHNIVAAKTEKSAKKKVNRRRLVYSLINC